MKPAAYVLRSATACLLALALTACGGGGSSGGSTSGTFSAGLTDAPSADYQNVWVTIREIDLHADPNASPTDPAWTSFPVSPPATVNLAALNHGNFQDVLSKITVPAGTYKQIRLMLVDDEAALTASATGAGLTWNDQVDYLDNTGTLQHAPLELVGPRQGIGVFGTFTVAANADLHLVFDFDLDDDVVRFPDELTGLPAFTLKPHSLRVFDLADAGAITGTVDPSQLAAQNAGGAYNLVVKAEVLSADGTRHVVARATGVNPVTGAFTLFPLPMAGQSTRSFDVLVRGRNMDTTIVAGVAVAAGSTPASGATAVSSAAIPVHLDTEYTANLAAAASPTGSWLNFDQTVTALSAVPYEVRFRHANPFTGLIDTGFPLSAGSVWIGSYVAGGAPAFAAAVPAEGAGGFGAIADAIQYSASAPVAVSAAASSISIPQLSVDPTVAAATGTLQVDITTATPGRFDRAQLVVSRYGEIVDTVAVDPAILSGSGGTVTVSNLPAGTPAAPDRAAFYYAWLRVWKTTAIGTRVHVIPVLAFADFRTQNSATLGAALP